ncbi:hypothetical protein XANCAGTX0491_001788 [Xanthoria calcicola]
MSAVNLSLENGGNGPEEDLGEIILIDDLFRLRAKDKVQKPLIAFPKSESSVSDFEYFTGRDLDRFVEHAARHYLGLGLKLNEHARVAILGPTNIEWIATCFGLLRAGFAVVLLSPKLSAQAIINLLSETRCETAVHAESPQLNGVIEHVADQTSIMAIPILRRTGFDVPPSREPLLVRDIDKAKEADRSAIILHSSGSTGLPKPMYTNQKRYVQLSNPIGPGARDFMTLPMHHAFPMIMLPRQMYSRRTVFFPNANLPLTSQNITEALTVARPDAVYAVPFILKMLAEQPSSVELLRSCTEVATVGSRCPDELGHRLVEQGVHLCNEFGSTEIGRLGSSADRAPEDKDWAYLRIAESKMKHIWPRPIEDGQYEFVFREDYPVATESNSDDPPNSFRSKDVFSPHPTVPDAWKYLGRLDDRVTLINGEKVLPLPIEGRIKEHLLIKEAVVFGIDRPIPGSLVFRSEAAKDMADDEFIDAIWPKVEAANKNAEAFSKIGKSMIVPLPAGAEYPRTDKGSFIRPQIYKVFHKEIDDAYNRLDHNQEGTLQLDVPGLEEHLLRMGQEYLGQALANKTTDFFKAGMDSLRAIQMRGSLVRDLDLRGNGNELSRNIVFECATIENLARHLDQLRQGQTADTQDPMGAMRALIQKYSVTPKDTPGSKPLPDAQVVLLTGATGGLGSQLVSRLSFNPSISKIYCLLRGHQPLTRLHSSLQDRKLDLANSKITALASDLTLSSLGLDDATFSEIKSSITHIIHAAWPVNFQLPLASFEPHIQGLHNLLQLSLASPHTSPARLLFCSSVSTALGAPLRSHIPEAVIDHLDYALDMGYGRSKLVGEHIVAAAVRTAGAQASILRIGQVVGDGKFGMWNDREAFPSIIRSALTMGVLPELPIQCEWLPVDTLAACVIELAGLADVRGDGGAGEGEGMNASDRHGGAESNGNGKTNGTVDMEVRKSVTTPDAAADSDGNTTARFRDMDTNDHRGIDTTINKEPRSVSQQRRSKDHTMNLVYNLLSPHAMSWTHDFLPALHRAGLSFTPVPTETWLQRLRSFSRTDPSSSSNAANIPDRSNSSAAAADPDRNPALKLLQYYERTFGGGKDEARDGRVEFEIGVAKKDSAALRGAEDVVRSGLVGKMVGWWMGRWESGDGRVVNGGVEDGDVGRRREDVDEKEEKENTSEHEQSQKTDHSGNEECKEENVDGKKEQADINGPDQLRETDHSGNDDVQKEKIDYPDEKAKTNEAGQLPKPDHSEPDEGKTETTNGLNHQNKTNEAEKPPATV